MFDINKLIKYTQDLTILYVEDNKQSRESTQLLLDQLFRTVITANDGQEGLDKFRSNKIDFVVTDLNMPVLSGTAMVEQIKKDDPEIPTVILSAHDEEAFIKDSFEVGANYYLNKPIDMNKLFQTIYEILNTKH